MFMKWAAIVFMFLATVMAILSFSQGLWSLGIVNIVLVGANLRIYLKIREMEKETMIRHLRFVFGLHNALGLRGWRGGRPNRDGSRGRVVHGTHEMNNTLLYVLDENGNPVPEPDGMDLSLASFMRRSIIEMLDFIKTITV